MKKLLFYIVTMMLPIAASADAVEIDGIYYDLVHETKSAEVSSNPNKYEGNVKIPEKVYYHGIVGTSYQAKTKEVRSVAGGNGHAGWRGLALCPRHGAGETDLTDG